MVFFFLLIQNIGFGQQFSTKHYQIAQGVVSGYGKEMLQDNTGFLWINTETGISRFDGHKFLNFKIYASDIALTSKGLLMSSQKGLFRIIHEPDTVFFQSLLPHQSQIDKKSLHFPTHIFEDNHQNLWVIEKENIALLDIENKKVKQRFQFPEMPKFILQASPNFVHFFTENAKVYIWDLTTNKFINTDYQNFKNNIQKIESVFSPQKNEIWIGNTAITKLIIEKDGAIQIEQKSEEFPTPITCFVKTKNQKIYVGTQVGNGFEVNPNTLSLQKMYFQAENSSTPTSLTSGKLVQFFEDSYDYLWAISTQGYTRTKQHIFTSPQNFEKIYSGDVCELANGKKYVATNQLYFLDEIEEGIYEPKKVTINEKYNDKISRGFAQGNTLWYGTRDGFLLRIEDDKIIQEFDLTKYGGYIDEIFVDSQDNIWVCQIPKSTALPHLIRISKKSGITVYQSDKGVVGRPLQFRENNERLYFSAIGVDTYLFEYDSKNDKFLNLSQKLPFKKIENFEVHDFTPDNQRGFYLATTHGLLHYTLNKKIKRIDQNWNPEHKEVRSVSFDTEGNLWVGSSWHGIFKYSQSGNLINYTIQNGLLSNMMSYRGFYCDKAGKMWISTTDGLNYMQVNNCSLEFTVQPKFLYVKMNGKKIDEQKIEKYPCNTYLNLAFIIPGLSEKVEFEHRLVQIGHEDEVPWHSTPDGVDFYINEFSEGQHRFEIRAKKLGNYTYSPVLFYEFEILPIWYKTTIFAFIVLVFMMLSGIGVMYLYRLRHEKEEQKLEKIIAERTEQMSKQQEILRKNNYKLEAQKQEMQAQQEELMQQQEEIMSQRDYIEQKNSELEGQKEALKIQHTEVEKAYQNMRTISEIGQQVTATLDLEKAIGILYDEINQMVDAEDFGVGIYNAKQKQIHYQFYIKKSKRVPAFSTSVRENRFSAWVITNQKPVYINDLENEYSNYLNSLGSYINHPNEHRSIISLPLKVENRLIGLLTIRSSNANAYAQHHFVLVQALASYVATSLDNTQAYNNLEVANIEVRQRRKNIYDSLRYARKIQQSILPTTQMDNFFDDYFIIYRPKDVVSGDFYWLAELDNQLFISVADCTGHGVPGGFMSMIGNTLLREAVYISRIHSPAKILTELHHAVRNILHKENEKDSDGMDISILKIENYQGNEMRQVTFSDAKSPLLYIENEQIKSVTCNRRSVAGYTRNKKPFRELTLEVSAGTAIYLSSDGYSDQMSPTTRRLGTNTFYNILFQNHKKSMIRQKRELMIAFRTHQDTEIQRDDVTVLGFRI